LAIYNGLPRSDVAVATDFRSRGKAQDNRQGKLSREPWNTGTQ